MTAGESHGKGLVAIIDGVPAGLVIAESYINNELARRMSGYGRGKRMEIEKDTIEIIAGMRRGRTIGSPIGLVVYNRDYKIEELPEILCPRPGHADLAGMLKYGFKDARNVLERASARGTAVRVAAGSVAKLILKEFDIRIISHVTAIGLVKADTASLSFNELAKAENSELRCADAEAVTDMKREIDKAIKAGDTLGGAFEVVADGVPPGLGGYSEWDRKLDGLLARAVMSIQAVKGVAIGKGIESSSKLGSEVHDAIVYDSTKKEFRRTTNTAGGIEGGVTNGEMVIVKGFMKPIATLSNPLKSVDILTKKEAKAATERSDVTAVPACGVIAEAAVAFELASAFLAKFGGDSILEARRNYDSYMKSLREM